MVDEVGRHVMEAFDKSRKEGIEVTYQQTVLDPPRAGGVKTSSKEIHD